jgi:formate hydrogenlyase subunit 3/multisubunit Na+/H+ antiporter MnhD subunit
MPKMNTIAAIAGVSIGVLCGALVFVILFVVIAKTLQQMAMFNQNTAIVVALCTTLLCMVGLYRTFVQPSSAKAAVTQEVPPSLEFLLWPYTVMALVILCVLLVLFVRGLMGRRSHAPLSMDYVRRGKGTEASRESPRRAMWDSVSGRPSRTYKEGPCGRVGDGDRLKKLRTDLQNKEIRK